MNDFYYVNQSHTFIMFRHTTLHKDLMEFPMHNHNAYELYYLLSDHAEFKVEGHIYPVEKGDILLFNSREFHNVSFDVHKPYSRMVIKIERDALKSFVQCDYDLFSGFEQRRLGEGNHIPAAQAERYGLHSCIGELEQAVGDDVPERELLLQCALVRLLVSVNRAVAAAGQVTAPPPRNQKVMEIINYINGNLAEDLSLAALEKRFYISRCYLSHVFKQTTGFPISQYITSKRVKYADELIAGGVSTLEACMRSGFNDYSNFYKAFRRMTGHAPKQSKYIG